MSEDQNNKNVFDIDELLERFKDGSDKGDLDEFEREALEGFEQLENKEAVKNFVDTAHAKLSTRLSKKRKTERPRLQTYWLAAAGVVLIAALSVLFYSSLHENTGGNQVAIHTKEKTEKEELQEQTPVEEAKPQAPTGAGKVSGELKQTLDIQQLAKTNTGATKNFTTGKVANINKEAANKSERAETVTTNPGLASATISETNETEKPQPVLAKEMDDMLDKKVKTTEQEKPINYKKEEQDEAFAKADVSTKAKNAPEPEKKQASAPASSNGAVDYNYSTNSSLSEIKVMPEKGRKDRLKKTKVMSTEKAAEEASGTRQPYYSEGSNALNAEIKKRFEANEQLKTINQKLELLILITADGKVKSVKSVDLNNDVLATQIEKEIKAITGKFIPASENGKTKEAEFMYVYQP